eukprot:GSChrysophyteH1.ASY1.ANO1.153.1 assembled CDS
MSSQRFKVVLLGEGRVGKTSILLRFTKGQYDDRQVTGQERFHALSPIYYRDADGALLVYDITDAESFSRKNRNVLESDAIAYAESVGAQHFHTSAKANRGLTEVFNDLSQNMIARRAKSGADGGGGGRGGNSGGRHKQKLVIVDDAPRQQDAARGGCC